MEHSINQKIYDVMFQISSKFEDKVLCPIEIASDVFPKLKTFNQKYNAFITLTEDKASRQAEESSIRIQSGKKLPLDGVLVAIKDNFCTKDVPTTCASR